MKWSYKYSTNFDFISSSVLLAAKSLILVFLIISVNNKIINCLCCDKFCFPKYTIFSELSFLLSSFSSSPKSKTFSKFYARYLINDKEIKLLKNTLAISFQYYNDDKHIQFMCYLLNNIFNNTHIYGFIMDSANNSQFDFLNNIIDIIFHCLHYC